MAWFLGSAAGCTASGPGPGAGAPVAESPDASSSLPDGASSALPDAGAAPFFAAAPSVYVAKIKNILVGLPPTDDEIARVTSDPGQLSALIDGWMQLPSYRQKLTRFFQLAFQQTQVSAADFADQFYPKQIGINTTTTPRVVGNAQESFARTMMQLVDEGRPMTEGATTTRLMMTTAMKELYAFLDVWQIDDNGKVTDQFKKENPTANIIIEAAQGPIALAETLDPASPNFMHWYNADAPTAQAKVAGCPEDPIVLPPSGISLHYLLYGSIDGHKSSTGVQCPPFGGSATAPQLTEADFNDWQMVTLRAPNAGEATSKFFDLPALRKGNELVLSIPRVGFFSTPAFFANWQTNISNQMRVTVNQTLIVALGSSIDGTDHSVPPTASPPGLDKAHSGTPDCAFCHVTLDPLRSIFASNYSWNYHRQVDPLLTAEKGLFSFRGDSKPVTNMSEMASALAAHRLFPAAWVQKLCYYVNSAACSETDPEFLRVVEVFKNSNFAWNTLVKELLSSPLTTHAQKTETAMTQGEKIAVARRDHLCTALNARLGFADVCALDATTKKQGVIPSIVSGLPSDGYGRGATIPVLPNAPTLFYRAGLENICAAVAALVIDTPKAKQIANVKQWSSAAPSAAIGEFVGLVMALAPSDRRAAPAAVLLDQHFTQAVQSGASATDALRSTFVAACLSPSSISIGL